MTIYYLLLTEVISNSLKKSMSWANSLKEPLRLLKKRKSPLAQVENMECLWQMNKNETTCLGWDKILKKETCESMN